MVKSKITKKREVIAFTIIARNYYPQAASLAESFKKLHPGIDFFVFFIDDMCLKSPNFQAVPVKSVFPKKKLLELAFKYNITEFSTAVKPDIFLWLINRYQPKKIIYLDPDIYFYQKINYLLDLLNRHQCLLVPHRTQPTADDKKPNELDFMGCGYYNLGFVAFSVSNPVIDFLNWWSQKLYLYGYADVQKFMFTDQKWMDYAPCFLDTYIIREPGYDVAYWNLHQYLDKFKPSEITFFHFSGFVPEKNLLSKHQDRFSLDDIGDYRQLFTDYSQRLKFYHDLQPDLNSYVYPYGNFDNGVEINQTTKNIYRYSQEIEKQSFSSLFKTSPKNSFFSYINQVIHISKETKVLNYFLLLNQATPEIACEFPIEQPYNENDLAVYINWCLSFTSKVYGTPPHFLFIQHRLTPKLAKRKFSPKFEMNLIQTIAAIEKSKQSKNNNSFIIDSYRLILHRHPEPEGFQKNLSDLNSQKIPRDFFLYRIFSSQEFKLKNRHKPPLVFSFYKTLLLLKALYYLTVEYPFLKIFRSKKKSHHHFPAKEHINFDGWNISGYLDTESGVGESARGLIQVFDQAKIPVNLNNVEQQWLRRQDYSYVHRFTKKHQHNINLICVNADQLISVVETQLGKNYLQHKYNVGYWYWESDLFPEAYSINFDLVNEIWTATTFVQKAISLKSPRPVLCIPPSFIASSNKVTRFDYSKYHLDIDSKDFVFLNIFDSASIWQRKNPFGLINAFNKAFSQKPNVKLLIKTTRIQNSDIYPRLKAEIDRNPQIILLDGYLSQAEIISLTNQAQCFVSLHRAEGLGVPLINAHFLEKPVIATNYSANQDYENPENSFLVNYSPYVLDESIGPYPSQTLWADPDTDHAAFQMNTVFNSDSIRLRQICQKGREQVGQYFSPQRIMKLIKQRLPIINEFF